jgi:DNA-binding MarR family transcriptional regulator
MNGLCSVCSRERLFSRRSSADTVFSVTLPPSLTRWPGYLLTFIAEHTNDRFERGLAVDGLKGRHVSVLAVVDAEGPMSQRALGRRLRIDKSPLVGVIDELENGGLAERRRSARDRRIQEVHITEAGRRVLRRAEKLADRENERAFAVLDEGERAQLQAMLLRVAERQAG